MLTLLLLQVAAAQTAVDAERAFNAAAQSKGQWTAFREFMTDDAVVFTPQPVRAKETLPEKNPSIAVQWWPAESYVSCDGSVAVNTGPWVRPRANGYFTTVWVRQPNGGYKWVYDGGDQLAVPRPLPEKPRVVRASCGGRPEIDMGGCLSDTNTGCYAATDHSLQVHWSWMAGKRSFSVAIWTGHGWKTVLENIVTERAE
ncbi:hypothetical protein MZO42_17320 [Sphingomonas psychrotolerans]|uniref:DUF4440 domain-containing protein n=1 Tax=Sphingomonas psychrotolerans TaxID=1327635 RepID=A0ABU3N9B7_9SPHN|nr:hypothetical protein [Sphingomonas psychrotolerans]MDT8760464.1 hypothetical protein [Sphingomonas psychrotolerans]